MNKNYLVGSIVKARKFTHLFTDQFRTGQIIEILPNSCYSIVVQFNDGSKDKFNTSGHTFSFFYRNLEVIGHIGENIAIQFANYCISEGYGTDARPQDFQKFLETYNPKKNG